MADEIRIKRLSEILGNPLQGDVGNPLQRDAREAWAIFDRWYDSGRPSEELRLHDRYVVDVVVFDARVMNGGIHAFIVGEDGNYFPETLEALAAIGATGAYALLRNSCDLFPGGRPSADLKTREQQALDILNRPGLPPHCNFEDLVEGRVEENLHQLAMNYWRRQEREASK